MLTSTASQHVDALQQIDTHAEHLHPQTFVVKSNPVKTALDSRSNEKNECLKDKVECAHTNSCSNILSQNKMCSLINYGTQNLKWAHHTTSLTAMTQEK